MALNARKEKIVIEDREPENAEIVLDIAELSRQVEADEFRELGRERHANGDVADAAAYYQMSLELFPTAETYTCLATALAAQGEWTAAIAECECAIALDPCLGNPYNDVGVYLAELKRLPEALEWLDRAINAPEYDCRNYPWYHKGRIYEQMGRFIEARDSYARSCEIDSDWEPARIGYFRALGWLN